MTKDLIILGGFAGFTANIVKSIISWTLKFIGLTEFTFEHIALFYVIFFGLFMTQDATLTTLATPIPNLVLFFPHMVFGIITCWIIKKFYFLP